MTTDPSIVRDVQCLRNWIGRHRLAGFSEHDVRRHFPRLNPGRRAEIIAVLVSTGEISMQPTPVRIPGKSGRLPSPSYTVIPRAPADEALSTDLTRNLIRDAQSILDWIARGQRTGFSAREVRRHFSHLDSTRQDRALDWLTVNHWICPRPPKTGTVGRRPSPRYVVNPLKRPIVELYLYCLDLAVDPEITD